MDESENYMQPYDNGLQELREKRFLEYRKNMEWFALHGWAAINRLARQEIMNAFSQTNKEVEPMNFDGS